MLLADLEGPLQRFSPDNFLLQLSVRGGHHLQAAHGLLGPLAFRDVADIALDDVLAVLLIEVGHYFHLLITAILGLQRQVFIADFVLLF